MNVKESSMKTGFADSVYFERTGNIRDNVIECSKEELRDLVFFYIEKLDMLDKKAEEFHNIIDDALGYEGQMRAL